MEIVWYSNVREKLASIDGIMVESISYGESQSLLRAGLDGLAGPRFACAGLDWLRLNGTDKSLA